MFGIILLIISIISIFIGIYISITFLVKISSSFRLIKNGELLDEQLTGVVGDFVGGVVGTIWSFAGVILFFLALRLQSKELSLQLEELKSTRGVFKTQQFENTFFNLLKNHNEIRLGTELIEENYSLIQGENQIKYVKGNSAFEKIKTHLFKEKENLEKNVLKAQKALSSESDWKEEEINEFFKKIEDHYTVTYDELVDKPELKSKAIFKLTFKEYSGQLGHYFRNIYHILLYIKENEELEMSMHFNEELKGNKTGIYINNESIESKRIKRKYKKYSQFLQAQMSNTELLLLFYNALFFTESKKLVQYYGLIENLNIEDLLYYETDVKYYQEHADGLEKIPKSNLKTRDEILKI